MNDPLDRVANARRERRIVSGEALLAAVASGVCLALGPVGLVASIFLGVVALVFVWLRHGWARSEAMWLAMHEYDQRVARGDYS